MKSPWILNALLKLEPFSDILPHSYYLKQNYHVNIILFFQLNDYLQNPIFDKLIEILRRLSEGGNTVLVIEHNLDVIRTADYILDMGPEGGDGGGTLITEGTPEEVSKDPVSFTGQYIKL